MLRTFFRLYWKIYSFQGGWHREYAKYMRKHAFVRKQLNKQVNLFQQIYRENHPDVSESSFTLKINTLDFQICRYLFGAYADSNYYYSLYKKYGWILRNHFVTADRANFANHFLNDKESRELCNDKVKSAEYWKDWYKRNWFLKTEESVLSAEDLKTMFEPGGKCIAKPISDYGGHGIFVLDPEQPDFEEKLQRLNSAEDKYILESYLEQSGLLHSLNESSLNTVRLITVRHSDGTIETLASILRIGRSGSIVDNVSSGGISYDIDINTGIVYFGTDYRGNIYLTHPDTGLKIEGIQIPQWNEIQEFVYSAHEFAPEGLNFAAWDICLSEDGMYLIEVNHHPGVCARNPKKMNPWGRLKLLFKEYE